VIIRIESSFFVPGLQSYPVRCFAINLQGVTPVQVNAEENGEVSAA
jgi:hypothetical protein